MATAKARYTGDGSKIRLENFSKKLKGTLRSYYPRGNVETNTADENFVSEDPAGDFIGALLVEARWASEELEWQRLDSTKAELRAVQSDLFQLLEDAHDKLRNLPADFERLLSMEADPLGCADKIGELMEYVEAVAPAIDKLPPRERPAIKQHKVAVEMTVRVMRVLQDYGIKVSASGDTTFGYTSEAIQILKALGDEISLVRDPITWRDILIEAKKSVPDFK